MDHVNPEDLETLLKKLRRKKTAESHKATLNILVVKKDFTVEYTTVPYDLDYFKRMRGRLLDLGGASCAVVFSMAGSQEGDLLACSWKDGIYDFEGNADALVEQLKKEQREEEP